MALLQNISLKYAELVDRTGDTSEMWPQQLSWQMNKYANQAGMSQKSGVPDGYSPPYSFSMPIKEGGMSCFRGITGLGEVKETSVLTKGKTFPTTTIIGSGTIYQPSLTLLVQLATEIQGSGGILTSSVLSAIANMQSLAIGVGEISDTSSINVIAWCTALAIGSGDIDATMKGVAYMDALSSSEGSLVTAQSCATAVWSALASNFNVSGTMGAKLNSAASGGVDYGALADAVWDAEVSGRTSAQAGNILEKAKLIPALL